MERLRRFVFLFLLVTVHAHLVVANATEIQYKNPFEISKNKIHFDLKWNPSFRSSTPNEIAVLLDEVCLKKKTNSFFYEPNFFNQNKINYEKRSPVQTYKFTLPINISVEALQNLVANDSCVKGISHNRLAYAEENPNDPLIVKQIYLNSINYFPAYAYYFHPIFGIKRNPVIAIIDTGIDLNHNDLKNNLWVNEKELLGLPGIDDDSNGYIDDINGYNFVSNIGSPVHESANDHGTHVAGLAAAVAENNIGILGVAGAKAKIMALNVFGRNLASETVAIDRAIRYAADNGAHVINISINGIGESDTTAAAITYALSKGTMIVVSAGNKNQDIRDNFTFPASYADRYPGLIAVGAIDQRTKTRCDFSSYNNRMVKIAAPGCDALSPKNGLYSTLANNIYGYKSGTSMASPLVAAALSLAYVYESERRLQKPNVLEMEHLFLQSMESQASLENYFYQGRILNFSEITERLKDNYTE